MVSTQNGLSNSNQLHTKIKQNQQKATESNDIRNKSATRHDNRPSDWNKKSTNASTS